MLFRSEDAWQWAAQLTLAGVGLGAAALALVLAAREMRGVRPSLLVARAAFGAWLAVAIVLPLAVELASR